VAFFKQVVVANTLAPPRRQHRQHRHKVALLYETIDLDARADDSTPAPQEGVEKFGCADSKAEPIVVMNCGGIFPGNGISWHRGRGSSLV
jgi:hypothetical protein